MDNKCKDTIAIYRQKAIIGKIIDMIPYDPSYAEEVVRLRNTDRVRYFLNQDYESTLETQHKWYDDYLLRDNDILWVVKNKQGQMIGTNRIYDVDQNKAEKGSQIINEEFSLGAPFALESEIILVNFLFKKIGIKKIIAKIRDDNEKTKSMNVKMGFFETNYEIIRGVRYIIYELDNKDYNLSYFEDIINYWSNRNERIKAKASV